MARYIHSNPTIKIKELLSINKYYNIAALFLAVKKNDFGPVQEIYGDRGAFVEVRNVIHYSRFLKNLGDINHYPIGVGCQKVILRPHHHVVAAELAGYDYIAYMQTIEVGPDYGDNWVEKLACKDKLISYYPEMLESIKVIPCETSP